MRWKGGKLWNVNANITVLAQYSESESIYVNNCQYDYVTADDIFITDEQNKLMAYLVQSKTSVFLQKILRMEDRVVATYTRVVNGFLTDGAASVAHSCVSRYARDRRGEYIHQLDHSFLGTFSA